MSSLDFVDVTKDLGTRFRVVSLLPAAVLGLFILALVSSSAPGRAPSTDELTSRIDELSGWELVAIGLAVLVGAIVFEPLQVSLVRALEGYWGDSRLARLLSKPGTAINRMRRARLGELQQRLGTYDGSTAGQRERAAAKLQLYPPADAILPTKLGNVLRAGEIRAGDRYRLDAIAVWPRLYPVLSDETRAIVDDRRDQMDAAARFCVVFTVAGVISIPFVAGHGWWLAVPIVAFLLSWVSYRSAVSAAAGYGVAIATAFDLHRFDLRLALHLPLPPTLSEELQSNRELMKFLRQPQEQAYLLETTGRGIDLVYAHHEDEEDQASEPDAASPADPNGGEGA